MEGSNPDSILAVPGVLTTGDSSKRSLAAADNSKRSLKPEASTRSILKKPGTPVNPDSSKRSLNPDESNPGSANGGQDEEEVDLQPGNAPARDDPLRGSNRSAPDFLGKQDSHRSDAATRSGGHTLYKMIRKSASNVASTLRRQQSLSAMDSRIAAVDANANDNESGLNRLKLLKQKSMDRLDRLTGTGNTTRRSQTLGTISTGSDSNHRKSLGPSGDQKRKSLGPSGERRDTLMPETNRKSKHALDGSETRRDTLMPSSRRGFEIDPSSLEKSAQSKRPGFDLVQEDDFDQMMTDPNDTTSSVNAVKSSVSHKKSTMGNHWISILPVSNAAKQTLNRRVNEGRLQIVRRGAQTYAKCSVLRILAIKAPCCEEVLCRRGHDSLALSTYLPSVALAKDETFKKGIEKMNEEVAEGGVLQGGTFTPLGFMGGRRQVCQYDPSTCLLTQFEIYTLAVTVEAEINPELEDSCEWQPVGWWMQNVFDNEESFMMDKTNNIGEDSFAYRIPLWTVHGVARRRGLAGNLVGTVTRHNNGLKIHNAPKMPHVVTQLEGDAIQIDEWLRENDLRMVNDADDNQESRKRLMKLCEDLREELDKRKCRLFCEQQDMIKRKLRFGDEHEQLCGLVRETLLVRTRVFHWDDERLQLMHGTSHNPWYGTMSLHFMPFARMLPMFDCALLAKEGPAADMFPRNRGLDTLKDKADIGIDDLDLSTLRFLTPYEELDWPRSYPGLLTRYLVHEVHVRLKHRPEKWGPPPETNDSNSVPPAQNTDGLDAQHDSNDAIEKDLQKVLKGRSSVSSVMSDVSAMSDVESNGDEQDACDWDFWSTKIAHVKKKKDGEETLLWVTRDEYERHHPAAHFDRMLRRINFAKVFCANQVAQSRTCSWEPYVFVEAAKHGHIAVLYECLGALVLAEKEDVDLIKELDKAVKSAALHFQTEAVRMLIAERLNYVCSPEDLRKLLLLAAESGEHCSVNQLLELGVSADGLERFGSNLNVMRVAIEHCTDFRSFNEPHSAYGRLASRFLKRWVRIEARTGSLRRAALELLEACQLPLHSAIALTWWLRHLASLATSQTECTNYEQQAESFASVMLVALDQCADVQEACKILMLEDTPSSNKGIVRSAIRGGGKTVMDMAIEAQVKTVIAHPFFQIVGASRLFGNELTQQLFLLFDKRGVLLRTVWRYSLNGYWVVLVLLTLPAVILGVIIPRVAVWHHRAFFVLHQPYGKMVTYNALYLGFVGVLTYVSILQPNSSALGPELYLSIPVLDAVLYLWAAALGLNQLESFFSIIVRTDSCYRSHAVETFSRNFLVKIDSVICAFFVGAFVCHIYAHQVGNRQDEGPIMERQLFGVASVFAGYRLLHLFTLSDDFGPLWFCMRKIGSDVSLFSVVLLLSLWFYFVGVSYMTTSGVGLWLSDGDADGRGTNQNSANLLITLIMSLFGQIETPRSESPLFLLVFFCCIFANVVILFNLLVAMMANTYATVYESADGLRSAERFLLVEEYRNFSSVPPPLNLIVFPVKVIWRSLYALLLCLVWVINYIRAKTAGDSPPKLSDTFVDLFVDRTGGTFRSSDQQWAFVDSKVWRKHRDQMEVREFVRDVCARMRAEERDALNEVSEVLSDALDPSHTTQLPQWAREQGQPALFDVEAMDQLEAKLLKLLQHHNISTDNWPRGIAQLRSDVHSGCCTLTLHSQGPEDIPQLSSRLLRPKQNIDVTQKQLLRTMHVMRVVVRLRGRPNRCLVKLYIMEGDRVQMRDTLPAVPYSPKDVQQGADLDLVAARAVATEVGEEVEGQVVEVRGVQLFHGGLPVLELPDDVNYPGLESLASVISAEVTVTGLPSYDFFTEDSEDEQRRVYWKWRTDEEVAALFEQRRCTATPTASARQAGISSKKSSAQVGKRSSLRNEVYHQNSLAKDHHNSRGLKTMNKTISDKNRAVKNPRSSWGVSR